jgi:hypothetical protein
MNMNGSKFQVPGSWFVFTFGSRFLFSVPRTLEP